MLKIISERCELVKLCHIKCSGQIFFRHTVYLLRQTSLTIIINFYGLNLVAYSSKK